MCICHYCALHRLAKDLIQSDNGKSVALNKIAQYIACSHTRKLIDVAESKGIDRLTEKGIVANGVEYEVDCVVFASGFEISTEISRRFAIDSIIGRDGLSLFEYWKDDYKTLHGMTSRGFPNQFFMGFIQGGVSANTTAMLEQQAEHIAYIIAETLRRGGIRFLSEREVASEDVFFLLDVLDHAACAVGIPGASYC